MQEYLNVAYKIQEPNCLQIKYLQNPRRQIPCPLSILEFFITPRNIIQKLLS